MLHLRVGIVLFEKRGRVLSTLESLVIKQQGSKSVFGLPPSQELIVADLAIPRGIEGHDSNFGLCWGNKAPKIIAQVLQVVCRDRAAPICVEFI